MKKINAFLIISMILCSMLIFPSFTENASSIGQHEVNDGTAIGYITSDVFPTGSPDSLILRPDADGDVTQWFAVGQSNRWECIDEAVANDETDYIESPTTCDNYTALFGLPNPEEKGSVCSVTVHVRGRRKDADFTNKAGTYIRLKTHGTIYSSIRYSWGVTWIDEEYTWDTNPYTNDNWTREEINNLQIGITSWPVGSCYPTWCTQMYGRINHTAGFNVTRTTGVLTEMNNFSFTPDGDYSENVKLKIPVSTDVKGIIDVTNNTGSILATEVNTSDELVDNTFWYDSANQFVHIRTISFTTSTTVNWTVNCSCGATFNLIIPSYLEVGQYFESEGFIQDSDGNAISGMIAETRLLYANGTDALAVNPKHNCTSGNYNCRFSTSTLIPGTYSVSIEFTDPTSGIVFKEGGTLYLSVDPGSGVHVASNLHFTFYDEDTGVGLNSESFKIYVDDEIPLDSSDRIYRDTYNTYTGQTLYYNVTDYFDNQVYPTSGTSKSLSIASTEQFEDVPIAWNSFSVKNMNHSIVYFKMTNGSTTYSQYLYPYEPFYWNVLDGKYTINLTYYNAVTDAIEDYFEEDITITTDQYYWIRGYDLRDIIIDIQFCNSTVGDVNLNIVTKITAQNSNITTLNINLNNNIALLESNITTVNNNIWNSLNITNSTIHDALNNNIWNAINISDTALKVLNNNIWNAINVTDLVVDSINTNIWNRFIAQGVTINSTRVTINSNIELLESNITSINHNIWSTVNTTNTNIGEMKVNINNNIQLMETNITSLEQSINSNIALSETNITTLTMSIHNNMILSESNLTQLNNLIWNSINISDTIIDYMNTSLWANFTSINTTINTQTNTINVQISNWGSYTQEYNNVPNCVSHWTFDEGSGTVANDSVGENDGVIVGGENWTDGKFGKCLEFDGEDDYIDCGHDSSLEIPETITISGWIKSAASVGIQIFLGRNTWGDGICFMVSVTGRQLHVNIENVIGYVDFQTALPLGVWTHLVMTYDKNAGANNLKIYINGATKVIRTRNTSIGPSTSDFYIGACPGSNYWLNSTVDEVRIYNRALSSDEISYLYNHSAKSASTTHIGNQINTISINITNIDTNITSMNNSISAAISVVDSVVDNLNTNIWNRFTALHSDLNETHVNINNNIELLETNITSLTSSINSHLTVTESNITAFTHNINNHITISESNITQLNNLLWNSINVTNSTVNTFNNAITSSLKLFESNVTDITQSINTNIAITESNITSLSQSVNSNIALSESNITSFTNNINNHITISESNITQLNNLIWDAINLTDTAITNFNNSIVSNIELFESNITSLSQSVNTNLVLMESNVTDITQSINTNIGIFESNITTLSSSINSHITLTESNLTTLNNFIEHITQIQNSTLNYVNSTVLSQLSLINTNISYITTNLTVNYDVINSSIDTMNADINSNIKFLESNVTTLTTSVNSHITLSESNLTTLNNAINSALSVVDSTVDNINNNIWTNLTYINISANYINDNIWTEINLVRSDVGSMETNVNTQIHIVESNITQLSNLIWNSINMTDLAVTNLNNTIQNEFNFISNNITQINQSVNYVNKTVWNNFTVIGTEVTDFSLSIHTMVDLSEANLTSLNIDLWNSINLTDAIVTYLNNTLENDITMINTTVDYINNNIWSEITAVNSNINELNSDINSNIILLETNLTTMTSDINSNIILTESNLTSLTCSINSHVTLLETNLTTLNNALKNIVQIQNSTLNYVNNTIWSKLNLIETNLSYITTNITIDYAVINSSIDSMKLNINNNIGLFESNITTLSMSINTNIQLTESNLTQLNNQIWTAINTTDSIVDTINSNVDVAISTVDTKIDTINSKLSIDFSLLNVNISNINDNIWSNFTVLESKVDAINVSISSNITVNNTVIQSLVNKFWASMNITDSIVGHINNTIWGELTAINVTVNDLSNTMTSQFNMVNSTLKNVNITINGELNIDDTNITNMIANIWGSVNISNSTMKYMNATIWGQFTLIDTNIDGVEVTVQGVWSDQNSSFVELTNRSRVMFSFYNTNTGLGIPWEALRIYINNTRLTDYRYECTNGTWLRLNVTDYYGNEMVVYNFNVSAPFTAISLGLTMHSWLFGNMNEDYYMISLLKSGASRWWERGIVPYGEREFLIPSGTYCLRIYDRDDVELYNSTLPASINVVNSKVYVIFGTNLSLVIDGQSVIKGQLLALDYYVRPDIIEVGLNLPYIYSVYDQKGALYLENIELICPPQVLTATVYNPGYTNTTIDLLIPNNGTVNGTITLLEDALYFHGSPATVTWVNVSYASNGTLIQNTTYIPYYLKLTGDNVTVHASANVSFERKSRFQQVQMFDWMKYLDTKKYVATVNFSNIMANYYDDVYLFISFADEEDENTPDYSRTTVYDETNKKYLVSGKHFDQSAAGVHFAIPTINGGNERKFTVTYYAGEESITPSEAVTVVNNFDLEETYNERSYYFIVAQWVNTRSGTFIGPIHIQFNFTFSRNVAPDSIEIWDETNRKYLTREDFVFNPTGVTITQEAVGRVEPQSERSYKIYYLYTDTTTPTIDTVADETSNILKQTAFPTPIGNMPYALVIIIVLFALGLVSVVGKEKKKLKDWWFMLIMLLFIFLVSMAYLAPG